MSRGQKPPSQRQLRVGEEIRHALVRILRSDRLRDPDLAGVSVTVTEVRVSPDLKAATAYVTRFGGGEANTVVSALQRAAGFLQRELAGEIELRVLPKMSFAHDTRFERAHAIERILADPKVARDLTDGEGLDEDDGA
jgi:ribosome-binding factor A